MRKVLAAAAAALFIIGVFATPASANDNSGGRREVPTTTVPEPTTTTTTVAPTTTTTVAPTPTTTVPPAPVPPAPGPGPADIPEPTPTPVPAPRQNPTPAPAPAPAPAPTPTTTTTIPPAAPVADAAVDCVAGIIVTGTNTGGESAALTIVIDGNVVEELVVHPGQTETYVFDLNPADAGSTKTVQVFHGDVAIYDTVLEVECGNIAATPCEAAPVAAAGTPAVEETTDSGCTNPCWWAPLALAVGVALGRRRRNGNLNAAGITAGIGGLLYALVAAGATPFAWAGLAVLAIAGAVKFANLNRGATSVEDEDTEEVEDAEDEESPAETP